ncbi:MAG: class I SAM-dependent RNA methyltransferase [Lachnospiraceae bacterium]|nr:class I SAM-dependent RNA methyltransferase [Lachnospiraceae bacterium]
MMYLCPCHFGLEAVLKRELAGLGLTVTRVEDGRVFFEGEPLAAARANVFLRTAERVQLVMGEFDATTFDELFEGVKALAWDEILPVDANFFVSKAYSVKSKLFSPSDIQRITGKAVVEAMKRKHRLTIFPKSGASFPIRIAIIKDRVTVSIDTSGESLHKRGYRRMRSAAPISETLAAAIIMLTPWREDRILVDPFCGCGTIPIEAAMIGRNIAPGVSRSFAGESYPFITTSMWANAREEAKSLTVPDRKMSIEGYDIDSEIVAAARQNAAAAGVLDTIHFQARDMRALSSSHQYGFIITNPPYGERLSPTTAGSDIKGTKSAAKTVMTDADIKELPALYKDMGEVFGKLKNWSYFFVTSYDKAQESFGRKADKNRKIYNGMIKTYLYEYYGPKPPKRDGDRPGQNR